jgi:hypothetical protein
LSHGLARSRTVLSCESVFRRFQAAVVVLALLIAPLALYARGAADAMRDCNGMCCLPHAHSMSMPMAMPAAEPPQRAESPTAAEPECHHEAAAKVAARQSAAAHTQQSPETQHTASANRSAAMQCALHCAAHRAPHSGSFGLLVPIAPTKPSSIVMIRVAIDSQRLALAGAQASPHGFLASPFQPPRA